MEEKMLTAGKVSLEHGWVQRKVFLAGDNVFAEASTRLAHI